MYNVTEFKIHKALIQSMTNCMNLHIILFIYGVRHPFIFVNDMQITFKFLFSFITLM